MTKHLPCFFFVRISDFFFVRNSVFFFLSLCSSGIILILYSKYIFWFISFFVAYFPTRSLYVHVYPHAAWKGWWGLVLYKYDIASAMPLYPGSCVGVIAARDWVADSRGTQKHHHTTTVAHVLLCILACERSTPPTLQKPRVLLLKLST